jgi:hypothetical protein
MILELLGTKYAGIALDLALFGGAFSTLWAMIKVSYESKAGKPFPKNKVTLFLDVLTDLLPNLPGALHTVAKAQGTRLFLPEAPVTPSEDK